MRHLARKGGEEKYTQGFGRITQRKETRDLCVAGRKILKWILEVGWKSVYWVLLTNSMDKWRDLVHPAMNIRVP